MYKLLTKIITIWITSRKELYQSLLLKVRKFQNNFKIAKYIRKHNNYSTESQTHIHRVRGVRQFDIVSSYLEWLFLAADLLIVNNDEDSRDGYWITESVLQKEPNWISLKLKWWSAYKNIEIYYLNISEYVNEYTAK